MLAETKNAQINTRTLVNFSYFFTFDHNSRLLVLKIVCNLNQVRSTRQISASITFIAEKSEVIVYSVYTYRNKLIFHTFQYRLYIMKVPLYCFAKKFKTQDDSSVWLQTQEFESNLMRHQYQDLLNWMIFCCCVFQLLFSVL